MLGVTADKKYNRSDTSIPDTETLPSTYLPNRAIWPSTRPNQSPIVIEENQSNKVFFEAQTNYQSLMKAISIECRLQNADRV